MAALSDKDRKFLNDNFPEFGTAWAGGLDALAQHFAIEAKSKWRSIHVHLTFRAPPALRYTLEITRKNGSMRTHGPSLPEAPELTPEELVRVDEILRAEGELWLIEPPNGDVRVRDLRGGLSALRGERVLETRRMGRRAILYMREEEGWGDHFCVWLDLDGGVEGVAWIDVPMDPGGRWLSREDVEFIDKAMREHGDFGVYGNVQDGLRALATHMELRIREDEQAFHVSATPPDGHGHFLRFPIFKASGEIGACAAGHIEPMVWENPDVDIE